MPRFAIALLLVLTLALLIPAKTAEANEVPPRFSLEAGVGLPITYYHARAAYRLPGIAEDRVGVFLDASVFEAAFGASASAGVIMAGARCYLNDWGPLSPYAFVGVAGVISTYQGMNASYQQIDGGLAGGMGLDWMWTPHVGLNAQLGGLGGVRNGLPLILPR